MRRGVVLVAVIAAGSLSIAAAGYQQAQPAPTVREIQNLRANLYFISGGDTNDRSTWGGGNTLVWVTERGVVLVDTMLPGAGRSLIERVRSITDKPVIMIINTHTHFDHSGSNTEFPATVEFVAHENTKANMARAKCAPVTNCQAFQGPNAKYLPSRTYGDRLSLFSGPEQIDLYYFGRGHTSGDSWVVFPAVRAMHTGDMFQRYTMPFIDTENSGGSAVAFNQTLQKAVATIRNVDTVVGGHTPTPVTWNAFREFTDFYNDFFRAVEAGLKAGRTVDEVTAAYRPAGKYVGYEADAARVRANAQAIYDELRR
jgi:glyoxylase-like metal-dependent hydrolase (beta-lactamase superfamily II)